MLLRAVLPLLCHASILLAIWPQPREHIDTGSQILRFNPDFQVVYDTIYRSGMESGFVPNFCHDCFGPNYRKPALSTEVMISAAVTRMKEDIMLKSFTFRKFYTDKTLPELNSLYSSPSIRLIRFLQMDFRANLDTPSNTEVYSLQIAENGIVYIKFVHPYGALCALTTFTQFFYKHSDGFVKHSHYNHAHKQHNTSNFQHLGSSNDHHAAIYYTPHASITVVDGPEFWHRGLDLDISGTLITPEDVMRTIDAMAFVKLNRLHLRGSGVASWLLEASHLPDVPTESAHRNHETWSPASLHEVQTFGAYRGVEVFLELDLLGHISSMLSKHSENFQGYSGQVLLQELIDPPLPPKFVNAANVDLPSVLALSYARTFVIDILSYTAQWSQLLHFGGGEFNKDADLASEAVVKDNLHFLLEDTHAFLSSSSIFPVVWGELLLDYNLTLSEGVIVESRGPGKNKSSSLAEIVKRGALAIFGPDHWFLEPETEDEHGYNFGSTGGSDKAPHVSGFGAIGNWRQILSYEPLADIPKAQEDNVKGGKVHMRAGNLQGASLDHSLWPRVAAAAAVLWEGKCALHEGTTSRLAEMNKWLKVKGIAAARVKFTLSLME